MQLRVEGNIKKEINKVIKAYIHTPWVIYPRVVSKNEIDIICSEEKEVIKLTAKTWQDNYYNELAERARLDLYTYTFGGGDHKYISSQYVPSWGEQPDETYNIIKKVVATFYDIYSYYEERKELSKKTPDISPGSLRSRLNREFYGKEWGI